MKVKYKADKVTLKIGGNEIKCVGYVYFDNGLRNNGIKTNWLKLFNRFIKFLIGNQIQGGGYKVGPITPKPNIRPIGHGKCQ